MMGEERQIIFYDGDCGMCNRSVQQVLKYDEKGIFDYAPLHGETARQHHLKVSSNTIVLFKGGEYFYKSEAVMKIMEQLRGLPKALSCFSILPYRFMNLFYDLVAANRKKFFPNDEVCKIFPPDVKARFLE